ncbi:Ribonuclease E/G-like protein [Hyella patelloides LEGE 07179]|uniref:Ribonuclease E/G-like protein n=1 Tax=Hyella patelloides LEGE 07179 TaxID=945734 RepID=A0A563VSE1_9CYAN|nr:Rne/Rng family ribonuclease [Hyella patelloides]VEP14302.1 Ribonuclease E/G-like protein [Hyella patelloides LEGE 07179]
MPKQIIIAEQHQIAAVFWEEQIQELVVSTGTQQVSDIYLGSVENVIPGIDAAFVNIGDSERNGFIHVTDLGPLRLKKSAASITELLVPQQKAVVQVMKEPTGNKGPRLTGNITLPGRYLVLMPYGKGVKLSRRIREESERSRLRALAILVKPAGMGLLVRTEADGQPEEAITEDLEMLKSQWESIQEQASYAKPPTLLNRDDDFIQRVLRDMYSADVNTIMVDSQVAMKRVKQHLVNWSGGRSPQGVFVDYHREQQPILEYYRVNAAIREALKPRVELPSGGYIIIEPTEALTVIDVNSGSFTRSATARETVLWTNREAATEIARQLRLRNIGGVIVVDFIDMDTNPDRLKLLEHFNNALRADKARPQIAQLSELGLVELTRKRQGQNIYELFGQTCSSCGGLGHLAHLPGRQEHESLENPPITPLAVATNIVDTKERKVIDAPVEIETESSPYKLDLANHPNYQEQGVSNGNRRRRRRRNDLALKEDLSDSEVVVNYSRDRDRYSDNEQPSSNGDRNIPNFGEHDIALRDRKSRIPSRNPRRDEPQEKISVEMTDFEQEIYALMGVSPLIRLDREFKDPKSVLIQIRKPGEAEETEKETTKNIEITTDTDDKADEVDATPVQETLDFDVPEVESSETVESESESESELSSVVESTSSEVEEIQEEEEEEEITDGRRRRRRRSSAKKEVTV